MSTGTKTKSAALTDAGVSRDVLRSMKADPEGSAFVTIEGTVFRDSQKNGPKPAPEE